MPRRASVSLESDGLIVACCYPDASRLPRSRNFVCPVMTQHTPFGRPCDRPKILGFILSQSIRRRERLRSSGLVLARQRPVILSSAPRPVANKCAPCTLRGGQTGTFIIEGSLLLRTFPVPRRDQAAPDAAMQANSVLLSGLTGFVNESEEHIAAIL